MKKIIITALALICLCLGSVNAFAADTEVFVDVPESHSINVTVGDGGVVIEGQKIHSEKFIATIEHNGSLSLILRPESGYVVDQVLLDGRDMSAELKGGVLTLNQVMEDSTLNVTYKKEAPANSLVSYTIVGTVIENGKPAQGVTLELRSSLKTFITGADGKFRFNKVEGGHHSITALRDGKVVGYIEFSLQQGQSGNKNVSITELPDGTFMVTISKNVALLKLDIAMASDGTIKITHADAISEAQTQDTYPPNTGDNSHILFWAVAMGMAGSLILYLLRKRRKKMA